MNNPYLYEVSCYDCANCKYKNQKDPYCISACIKCNQMYPQIFNNGNYFNPQSMWYNPSQFPYGNYYGSYNYPNYYGFMY